jgi:hypothetical protein
MNALLAKLKALPRAATWAIGALLLLVAYFGVIEPVLDATNAARSRADALAAGLQKERALTSTDSDQGRTLANGRRSFGEPYLPEHPDNKPEALHTRVDTILGDRGITTRVKNERRIRIAGDEAAKLLGPLAATSNVERLILDITFDASPETIASILSDLEQAKEVAAISRVELRRPDATGSRGAAAPASGSRTVKATISAEAWVLSKSSGASPAGGSR